MSRPASLTLLSRLPQIESKISLALGGVTIVMLSVAASLGFYGYVGVPATLFVIEVSIGFAPLPELAV